MSHFWEASFSLMVKSHCTLTDCKRDSKALSCAEKLSMTFHSESIHTKLFGITLAVKIVYSIISCIVNANGNANGSFILSVSVTAVTTLQ